MLIGWHWTQTPPSLTLYYYIPHYTVALHYYCLLFSLFRFLSSTDFLPPRFVSAAGWLPDVSACDSSVLCACVYIICSHNMPINCLQTRHLFDGMRHIMMIMRLCAMSDGLLWNVRKRTEQQFLSNLQTAFIQCPLSHGHTRATQIHNLKYPGAFWSTLTSGVPPNTCQKHFWQTPRNKSRLWTTKCPGLNEHNYHPSAHYR